MISLGWVIIESGISDAIPLIYNIQNPVSLNTEEIKEEKNPSQRAPNSFNPVSVWKVLKCFFTTSVVTYSIFFLPFPSHSLDNLLHVAHLFSASVYYVISAMCSCRHLCFVFWSVLTFKVLITVILAPSFKEWA